MDYKKTMLASRQKLTFVDSCKKNKPMYFMSLKVCKDINQYLGHVFFSQCEDFMILETNLFWGKKKTGEQKTDCRNSLL